MSLVGNSENKKILNNNNMEMELYLNKNSAFVDVPMERILRASDASVASCTWRIELRKPLGNFKWLSPQCSVDHKRQPLLEEFISKLDWTSAKYQKEKGGDRYHLCIHIITDLRGPSGFRTEDVKLRVHGFLGDMLAAFLDSGNKFHLKLEIGLENYPQLDSADIPVSSQGALGPAPADDDDVCIRNEKYFEGTLSKGSAFHEYFIPKMRGFMNVILTRDKVLSADRARMLEMICQKIMKEQIQTDMTIVTSDGKELACNKAFLAAHSPVFAAMFRKPMMKEAETQKIEMVDMVEADVQALLKYLYCMDVTASNENSSIALKLLKAGHKYNIPHLEKEMGSIFSVKPAIWCGVTAALELFLFARQLDNDHCGYELKMKAVDVLKLKAGHWYIESLKELGLEDMELAANILLELFQLVSSSQVKGGLNEWCGTGYIP